MSSQTTEEASPMTAPPTGGETWYQEFYAGIDRQDLTVVDRLCTPDTTMRFANHPMDVGPEAVRAGMEHFFSLIGGMRHTFVKVLEQGDSAVLEAVVQYTRLDGSTVDICVSTAIDRRDGLVAAQRVYIDLAPLFQSGPVD